MIHGPSNVKILISLSLKGHFNLLKAVLKGRIKKTVIADKLCEEAIR